jgi:hypothetical protein
MRGFSWGTHLSTEKENQIDKMRKEIPVIENEIASLENEILRIW